MAKQVKSAADADLLSGGEPIGDLGHNAVFDDNTFDALTGGDNANQDGTQSGGKGPAGTDDKRFQYWQSQATILANEKARLEAELQKVSVYKPLADLIEKDDELLNIVEAKIKGKQAPVVEAPKLPVRPDNYNAAEAYTVPDSASFKYQRSLEEYNDARMTYLESKANQGIEAANNVRQEKLQEQRRQNELNTTAAQLMGVYGYDAPMVQDFVARFTDPRSLSLENLVQYHQTILAGEQAAPTGQRGNQRIPAAQQRRELLRKSPPPPGAGASNSMEFLESDASGMDSMMQSWVNSSRKQNQSRGL